MWTIFNYSCYESGLACQFTVGPSIGTQIIQLIKVLHDKEYAYTGENGDIYYDVKKYKKYGNLSYVNVHDLRSGVRIKKDNFKKCDLDFVLWKLSKSDSPAWNSPWGRGRPGWHIECSVMSMYYLGKRFDIHGGGLDLKFPHHENECAQSESFSNAKFANLWMHVGFLQLNSKKMSKSLGNVTKIRDILQGIEYY